MVKSNILKYKYGFKHYLNLLFVNINLAFKSMFEYKINFYSSIIKNALVASFYLLFAKIIDNVTDGVLDWTYHDFILFIYFISLTTGIGFTLMEDKNLESDIINGVLNKILLKPGNRILNYLTYQVDSGLIYLLTYNIIFLPYVLISSNYTFLSLILSFCLVLILAILFALLYEFLISFSWYFLKLGTTFENSFYSIDHIYRNFPANIFEYSKFKHLLIFMPTYFVGVLVVPLFQNKQIINFNQNLFLIIFLFLFFIIGIEINWNYGLKRYEAFG